MVFLLDLPPEILQQVLLDCTTPSFFHAIRSCKTFFKLAESHRAVLLHHLEQAPGITLGLQDPDFSTKDLFLTLRRRGAEHLIGSNISADCNEISAGYGTIDPKASYIGDGVVALALRDSFRVRLYDVQGVSCKLKNANAGGLAPSTGVGKILKNITLAGKTHTLFSYSPHSAISEPTEAEKLGPSHRPIDREFDEENSAMVDIDLSSLSLGDTCYYLAHGGIASSGEVYLEVPPPIPWLGRTLVPIDFATYGALQCAVLWDLPDSVEPSVFAQVIKYTVAKLPQAGVQSEYTCQRVWPVGKRPNETKPPKLRRKHLSASTPHSLECFGPPKPQPLPLRVAEVLRSPEMTKLPRSIAFAHFGRRIELFSPGEIVPFYVTKTSETRQASEDEDTLDPFEAQINPWLCSLHGLRWKATTSFYGHHVTRLSKSSTNDLNEDTEFEQICSISYLSLATTKISGSRHPPRGTCLAKENDDIEVLCVLRAVKTSPSNECGHLYHTDLCSAIHYSNLKVVARLWGWQPSPSSLAGEHTLATCETRIAIAQWDRVFIWSLAPDALLDEADDPAPPNATDGDNSDDDDNSNASEKEKEAEPEAGEVRTARAWTYPKIYDATMEAWYVELKPIVLNVSNKSGTNLITGGGAHRGSNNNAKHPVVIKQLMWTNPSTLVVRTDHGLQIWNVGPSATGKRTTEVLEMDIMDNGGEGGAAAGGGGPTIDSTLFEKACSLQG